MDCKCGCGEPVKSRRVFANKEHQLEWMLAGGAKQIGALEPPEARQRGGHTAGTKASASGRLAEAGIKGAERSREIAAEYRRRRTDG